VCRYFLQGSASLRLGIDTMEVWGSSPHEPTTHHCFNDLRMKYSDGLRGCPVCATTSSQFAARDCVPFLDSFRSNTLRPDERPGRLVRAAWFGFDLFRSSSLPSAQDRMSESEVASLLHQILPNDRG